MLPPEVASMREAIMNPLRCGGLDSVYQIRERESTGRLKIQMDVIPRAPSAEKLPTSSVNYGGRAGEQSRAPLRIEPWPAILGGPYQVNSKREIGIHSRDPPERCRSDRLLRIARLRTDRGTAHARRGAKFPGNTYVSRRRVVTPPNPKPRVIRDRLGAPPPSAAGGRA
jgi:hypothetical protein